MTKKFIIFFTKVPIDPPNQFYPNLPQQSKSNVVFSPTPFVGWGEVCTYFGSSCKLLKIYELPIIDSSFFPFLISHIAVIKTVY